MVNFIHEPPPGEIVVITEDHGGLVNKYENAVQVYNRQGRRVEIRGDCNSACTLALAVKNSCVGQGAIVRWHQAYDGVTDEPMPEVTQRMLYQMPARVRNYLDGKIRRNYSPEATLNYTQLVALGVPDCDAPSYKANTITAEIGYKTNITAPIPKNVTAVTAPDREYTAHSVAEQKEMDWAKYWEWAANTSKQQFGKIHTRQFDFGNGKKSINIYYWDRNHQYVTAIQYTKDGIPGDRKVCRGDEVVPDELTCTEWTSGRVVTYEYNEYKDTYDEVSG